MLISEDQPHTLMPYNRIEFSMAKHVLAVVILVIQVIRLLKYTYIAEISHTQSIFYLLSTIKFYKQFVISIKIKQ